MSNKLWEVFALIISLVLAFKFFGGSVWMMIIIYGVFLLYKRDEWKYEKKYIIVRAISTLGLLAIILGKIIVDDLFVIMGGALVACTLAPLIVMDFYYYYKK